MSIPTVDLVTRLDFSDPSCYSGSGSTVYDLVSNNDFAITGATFVSDGLKSYFSFAGGGSKLQVITPVDVSSQTVFTFSAWAYSTGGSSAVQVLFGSGQNVGSGGVPHIALNVSEPNGVISSFGYGVGTAVGTTINQNQWYLLTMTCDGTTNKLYINDTLVGSASQSTGNIYNDPTNFVIGQYSDVETSIPWIGRVGAYYYYDAALTAGEVASLYNDTSPRFDNKIISYDFSDPTCYPGTGNTVYDLSGSGINATVQSAVTFNSAGNQSSFIFNNSWPNTNIEANFTPPSQTVWTFNTWIYPTVDTVSAFIFAGDGGNGSGPYVTYNGSWPSILNTFLSSNGFGTGTINANSYPYAKNNWYMVSYSSDGTTLKLYVNATEIGSASAAGVALPAGVIPFRLGGNTDTTYQFTGKIAIAEFYDKALSAGEITTIYNDTVSRFAPAPAYQGIVGGRQFAQGFNG